MVKKEALDSACLIHALALPLPGCDVGRWFKRQCWHFVPSAQQDDVCADLKGLFDVEVGVKCLQHAWYLGALSIS